MDSCVEIHTLMTYMAKCHRHYLECMVHSQLKSLQEAFKDVQFITSYRQPPSLLRQITNAEFITSVEEATRGIKLCKNSACKICKMYLQKCDSFETANGTIWQIKCHIDCNSKNVLYYQICNFCSKVSNVGKTDDLRERTNNHISCCRHGSGTDIFDLHVHECEKLQKQFLEKKTIYSTNHTSNYTFL